MPPSITATKRRLPAFRQILIPFIDDLRSLHHGVMSAAELNELKEDVENEAQKPQDPHHAHREKLDIFHPAKNEDGTDDAEPKGC